MTRFAITRFVREGDYCNENTVATFDTKEEALKALPTEKDIIEEIRKEDSARNHIWGNAHSKYGKHHHEYWGYEIVMETLDEDGVPTDWETIDSVEVEVSKAFD